MSSPVPSSSYAENKENLDADLATIGNMEPPIPQGIEINRSIIRSTRVVASISCTGNNNKKPISISISNQGRASLSISTSRNSQKSYMLDGCYELEKSDSNEMYKKEVQPLVHGLFDGTNACIISYGTTKHLFEGWGEKKQSLLQFAMIDILEWANVNKACIDISIYDVFQDKIYDLLKPKSNESEVLINKDSKRQVQLKGLSKVSVETMADMNKYYLEGGKNRRGHRCLILYISKCKNTPVFSKINFLEFRGYNCSKVNKSLCSVMNIVHDLNNRKNHHISYRETKLAHLLQDFLSRESRSLVIACMEQVENEENKRVLALAAFSSRNAQKVLSLSKNQDQILNKRHTIIGTKKNPGSVDKCARKESGFNAEIVEKVQQSDTVTIVQKVIDTNDPTSEPLMQEMSMQEECIGGTDNISSNAVDVIGLGEPEECKSTESEAVEEFTNITLDNSIFEGTPAPKDPSSPKLSEQIKSMSNNFRAIHERLSNLDLTTPKRVEFSSNLFESKTPFGLQCAGTAQNSTKKCLSYLNSANKEDLKRLYGIGEVRSAAILKLREENPEPFKEVKDVREHLGITPKVFKQMAFSLFELDD